MPFEELLKQRVVERAEVPRREIIERLRAARHDIRISSIVASIDRDWAFSIAYNGILQTSVAYINFLGYRPRGEGKHMNVFRFMKEALPDALKDDVDRLQKMRQKRNRAVYETRGIVSQKELEHICAFAHSYFDEVLFLLPKSYAKALGE